MQMLWWERYGLDGFWVPFWFWGSLTSKIIYWEKKWFISKNVRKKKDLGTLCVTLPSVNFSSWMPPCAFWNAFYTKSTSFFWEPLTSSAACQMLEQKCQTIAHNKKIQEYNIHISLTSLPHFGLSYPAEKHNNWFPLLTTKFWFLASQN